MYISSLKVYIIFAVWDLRLLVIAVSRLQMQIIGDTLTSRIFSQTLYIMEKYIAIPVSLLGNNSHTPKVADLVAVNEQVQLRALKDFYDRYTSSIFIIVLINCSRSAIISSP